MPSVDNVKVVRCPFCRRTVTFTITRTLGNKARGNRSLAKNVELLMPRLTGEKQYWIVLL